MQKYVKSLSLITTTLIALSQPAMAQIRDDGTPPDGTIPEPASIACWGLLVVFGGMAYWWKSRRGK